MKTYEVLNDIPKQSRKTKDSLRTSEVEIVNLLMLLSSRAENRDVNALKIGHNELAGIRFKLAQALTLVDQTHAVLSECDSDFVALLTQKNVAIAVAETDLML